MKRVILSVLVSVWMIFTLAGCAKKVEEVEPMPVDKVKTCGSYSVSYDSRKYEIISGENQAQKLLTFADRKSDGTSEGISILVTADYGLLKNSGFPESLRDAKKCLLNVSTALNTSYYETERYYVESGEDYATDGGYSYHSLFAVPKGSAGDLAVYSLKFVYGDTYYPSQGLFELAMDAFGTVLGRELTIPYVATMDSLKALFDNVNGIGVMEYNYARDDAQTYIPRLRSGAYSLDGSLFEYIDVGGDENNLSPGTYLLSFLDGRGVFNQTDADMMPVNTFEISKKFDPVEIELNDNDRIFVDKNLSVKLTKRD